MKSTTTRTILIGSSMLVILVAILLAGNISSNNNTTRSWFFEDNASDFTHESFSSVKEFETFMAGHSRGNENSLVKVGDSASRTEGVVGATESSSPDYVSQTNNQVQGVDEADVFKTDGSYIYTTSENTLQIVSINPVNDSKVVSSLHLNNSPQGLFVHDNLLVVISQKQSGDRYSYLADQNTLLQFFDVDNKSDPRLVRNTSVKGSYNTARLINDSMYLVSSQQSYGNPISLPGVVEDGASKTVPVSSIIKYPLPYDHPSLVTVFSFDLSKKGVFEDSQSVVVDYVDSVYVSTSNVYVVSKERLNEWELQQDITKDVLKPLLDSEDRDLIAEIQSIDPKILSQGEKDSKIMTVYNRVLYSFSRQEQDEYQDTIERLVKEKVQSIEYFTHSIIHRFSIDDTTLSQGSSARVPGEIVNQFSLDEHDGLLRIATTIPQQWSRYNTETRESFSAVWVLDGDGTIIGNVSGIAEDERIYSTRFVEDTLYMVTFKQVDPFFVVDLGNPKNPVIEGSLKLPGFSKYLHPYGTDLIVGLGRNTTATGRQTGLKIALFDVSNPSQPRVLSEYVGDDRYVQTTAEFEHKAFLLSREKNLLVIPARDNDWSQESTSFDGALVFSISEKGISLQGLIDHSKSGKGRYGGPSVSRSAVVDDSLFTVSSTLLRANDVSSLKNISTVNLESKTDSDIPIY
ncbi:MAG: beta-propeller domain-containing protein [Nanobdellota archaeon]